MAEAPQHCSPPLFLKASAVEFNSVALRNANLWVMELPFQYPQMSMHERQLLQISLWRKLTRTQRWNSRLIDGISLLIDVRLPRLRIPAMPVKMVLRAFEGPMRLPLTRRRLASLTNRSRYSSERIVRELGFTYSRPMPTGIENIVAVMR